MKLTDIDIRKALIEKLIKENEKKEHRILEELVICDGSARADVVVANGLLKGYEIKSDVDTLDRLSNQVQKYDATFDKCIIVIGKKFEAKITGCVPEHWGIICAYQNKSGKISLKKIRSASYNKNITYNALTDLLWTIEIKSLMKDYKIRGYSNKTKSELVTMVQENFDLIKLKKYTRETLKYRQGWRVV